MKKPGYRGLEFPPLVLGSTPDIAAPPPETAPPETALSEAGPGEDRAVEAIFEPHPDDVLALTPQPQYEQATAQSPEPTPVRRRRSAPHPPTVEGKPINTVRKAQARAVVEMERTSKRESLPAWARYAYPAAIVLALIWAGSMIAFTQGYQFHDAPFAIPAFPPVTIGLMAILPACFILLSAYVLRQAARLSLETARARAMADELAIPAALAVDQAGGAADAVRREVARAAEAGETAQKQLLSLRETLAEESDKLVAATQEAERTARLLTESLSRERTQMEALTSDLDARVEAVNGAIERQTRLVAETSDLAAIQLQEAEAMLAARATGLATAAGEAGEAAELAGEALTRQADRLEAAGELVGSRLSGVSETLGRGHSRLSELAVQLQADQQALAARLEAQRQSAVVAAAEAQATLESAASGADSLTSALRDLIAEADQRLRSLAESVQGEQAALDARARATLALFRDAVIEERTGIESETAAALASLNRTAAATRDAAASSAEAARAKVEELGQAAFSAGELADRAFDARIGSARRAIEQASSLLEGAGQRSVERIDAGLAAARHALGDIEETLAAVDRRIAAAPEQALAQTQAIRSAVDSSLEAVAASARRIAAETEAVDVALQERVRRNYEMLSEALKTMGKVAAVTEQAAARAAQQPMAATAAARATTPVSLPPVAQPMSAIRISAPAPPAPLVQPIRADALASADVGLRPRLRLTPELPPSPAAERKPAVVVHETLEPFQKPTATVEPEPRRASNDWTWKDLLSGIDEPPIDDEVLAERLISEIEALGLDAAVLIPLARIDEIATAVHRGDHATARDAVRGLAPGAVRRLSRRVLTDKVLRAQANRYVRRYEELLSDSAKRDRDGFMTSALLGSEPGRAFLLFDAAVGELH